MFLLPKSTNSFLSKNDNNLNTNILNKSLKALKKKPIIKFLFFYIVLILIFSGILSSHAALKSNYLTNGMNNFHETWNYLFSLFFISSSFTNTGWQITNITQQFTIFGLIIIIIIMQIGALGITVIKLFIFKIFIYDKLFQKILISKDNKYLSNTNDKVTSFNYVRVSLIFFIFFCIIIILGSFFYAIYLCHSNSKALSNNLFNSYKNCLGYSYFLTVSGITNTGLELFGRFNSNGYSSLSAFANNYVTLFYLMFLIVCGGIGMPIYYLFFLKLRKWYFRNNIVENKIFKTMIKFSLFSYLIIFLISFSILLLIIWTPKKNNILPSNWNNWEKFVNILFLTISTRSAGFTTLKLLNLNLSVKIILLILIWIGTNPLSIGGGIRCTTFIIFLIGIYGYLNQSRKQINFYKWTFSKSTINHVNMIIFFSLILIIFYVWLFALINNNALASSQINLTQLIFIVVSALGTTGYDFSHLIYLKSCCLILIILPMLIGQLTITNWLIMLKKKNNNRNLYIKPETFVFLG